MPKQRAPEVASLLRELGQRTMLAGDNLYRSRAYLKAAESLAALAVPLEDLVQKGRLREIPGVGKTIADIIKKLHLTGTHPALEKMRQEIPAGVLDMLNIPGLRPERVMKLYKELGISSLEELEAAARAGDPKSNKTFSYALQRKVLQGLEIRRSARGARHIHRAAELIAAAEKSLVQSDVGLTRITPAGDFRRGCELVSDLGLVAQKPGSVPPERTSTGEWSMPKLLRNNLTYQ